MAYRMAGMAWYMTWSGWHSMVFGIAWRLWPDWHGMVYDMASLASHVIWYDLEGMSWFMVWLGGHGMIYSMAGRACRVYGRT